MKLTLTRLMLGAALGLAITYAVSAEQLTCGNYKYDVATNTEAMMCESLIIEDENFREAQRKVIGYARLIRTEAYATFPMRDISDGLAHVYGLDISKDPIVAAPYDLFRSKYQFMRDELKALKTILPFCNCSSKQLQRKINCILQGRKCGGKC